MIFPRPLAFFRSVLAEQTGIKGHEDLIQLCMGDVDMTRKTDKALDYFLVTDEPWFVRTPVEVSIIGFMSANGESLIGGDVPQINVRYAQLSLSAR